MATILFSFGAFLAFLSTEHGRESLESAVVGLVISGVAWAMGSVVCYGRPEIRSTSSQAVKARWAFTFLFAVSAAAWPWVGPVTQGLNLLFVAFFALGALVPALITLHAENAESLRDAFGKALIGSAVGAALSAVIWSLCGIGSLFLVASAAALLAPFLESSHFFSPSSLRPWSPRRWALVPLVIATLCLSFFAPSAWVPAGDPKASDSAPTFAFDSIFQFRKEKKFDVFVVGRRSTEPFASLPAETLEASLKSLTVTSSHPDEKAAVSLPSGVELTIHGGSARRRLAGESRRFDLIQVLVPSADVERKQPVWEATSETSLTVEAFRLYFDRLKDDGILQIVGALDGIKGQSTLATLAEAWKKSARPDIDIHAVAVTEATGKTVRSVILRMKSFSREERDKLGEILKVGGSAENRWLLVSDASGVVLSDDRPFVEPVFQMQSLQVSSRTLFWALIVLVLALIVWVAMQERRKGLASRWQTASVATYFAGLGVSFAFFQTYFVLKAMRGWGMPIVAAALVLSALFVARAAGATLLAGHPRRRYGVRIQPLVNFVFAVLLTYLGAALFEPLVSTGSEWVSAFVGMSVLIPFGLLGGAFFPNAMEEASEKLAPKVLSLLWALYIAGTAAGIYGALVVGFENGLDVVFLSGLFCFAWVAIFSGLVRPWNVRKTNP